MNEIVTQFYTVVLPIYCVSVSVRFDYSEELYKSITKHRAVNLCRKLCRC